MLCIDDVSYIYATIPLKKNPSKKKKKIPARKKYTYNKWKNIQKIFLIFFSFQGHTRKIRKFPG